MAKLSGRTKSVYFVRCSYFFQPIPYSTSHKQNQVQCCPIPLIKHSGFLGFILGKVNVVEEVFDLLLHVDIMDEKAVGAFE